MTHEGDASSSRAEARRVARETEQALVSALQDSDTPVELLNDELDHTTDGSDEAAASGQLAPPRRRLVAGAVLALLALLVARRRR